MTSFRVFVLVSFLAAIVMGSYFYVNHLNTSTQSITGASSTPSQTESANKAVENINQKTQKNLQDVQSQYGR
jgi:uncharacterized protein (UPF0333 family)